MIEQRYYLFDLRKCLLSSYKGRIKIYYYYYYYYYYLFMPKNEHFMQI